MNGNVEETKQTKQKKMVGGFISNFKQLVLKNQENKEYLPADRLVQIKKMFNQGLKSKDVDQKLKSIKTALNMAHPFYFKDVKSITIQHYIKSDPQLIEENKNFMEIMLIVQYQLLLLTDQSEAFSILETLSYLQPRSFTVLWNRFQVTMNNNVRIKILEYANTRFEQSKYMLTQEKEAICNLQTELEHLITLKKKQQQNKIYKHLFRYVGGILSLFTGILFKSKLTKLPNRYKRGVFFMVFGSSLFSFAYSYIKRM